MKNKIKIGNIVKVITGSYKGKIGKVLKILSKDYILVENINLIKKHVKPLSNKNNNGGCIIIKESKINISNVCKIDY